MITDDVQISYIRKPRNVIWAYGVGSLGQYVWDGTPGFSLAPVIPATGSVDFELDDIYEAKAHKWMLENIDLNQKILFWCVGRRFFDGMESIFTV